MLKKNRGSKRKTEYVCVERERERELSEEEEEEEEEER